MLQKHTHKVLKHTQKQSMLQTTQFCFEILCAKEPQLFSEYALCFLPLLAQMHPGRGLFPHQYLLEYYMHFFHYNTHRCNSHRIYYIFRDWHVQFLSASHPLCISSDKISIQNKKVKTFSHKKRCDVVPGTFLQFVKKPQNFEQNGI